MVFKGHRDSQLWEWAWRGTAECNFTPECKKRHLMCHYCRALITGRHMGRCARVCLLIASLCRSEHDSAPSTAESVGPSPWLTAQSL